jgi:hypothetical protein
MSRTALARSALVLVGMALAPLCALYVPAESVPAVEASSEATGDEVSVTVPEDRMRIKNEGLTVSLPLTEGLRLRVLQAIDRYPDATVRLSLRGVEPPLDRRAINGFNIFLNKPDATASTSETDPHFVRASEFQPTSESAPQPFSADVLRTLVRLQKRGELNLDKPLQITIVAIPASGYRQIPEEASFSVRELALSVPTFPRGGRNGRSASE